VNPANWPPVPQGLDQRIPVWGVDTVGVIEPRSITTPLPEVKWRERFDTPPELDPNPIIDEMVAATRRIEESGGEPTNPVNPEFYRAVEAVRPPARWSFEAKLHQESAALKAEVERLKAEVKRHRDKGVALSRLRDRVWHIAQDLKRSVNGVGID